jgi:predicted Zn-dependent protease
LSQRHFARGVEAQQRMQLPMMAALLAGIVPPRRALATPASA